MNKGDMPFVATLWLALLLALACALAPLGPPSSREAGSAFNPATTAVALKVRSPDIASMVRVADPDDARRSIGLDVPTLPAASAAVAEGRARPVQAWAGWTTARAPFAVRSGHRLARAPPVRV